MNRKQARQPGQVEPEPKRRPCQTLPKAVRIRRRSEFDRVFRERVRASDAVLTVYLGRNMGGEARLGIAAGRRLGNAVARNRIKRLVRETFRRFRAELPAGTDWVVVPQQAKASFQEVDTSLRRLSGRLIQRGGVESVGHGRTDRTETKKPSNSEARGGRAE